MRRYGLIFADELLDTHYLCCTTVIDLDVFNLSCRHLCNIYTSEVYGLPYLDYKVSKALHIKIQKPCMEYLVII